MSIYTSRYSNPELRKGIYTTVKISVGIPKRGLKYSLDGEISDLMPFGLRGEQYDNDKELFKQAYFALLDKAGVTKIKAQLAQFQAKGRDVVLLCYENIRKGENHWCHRTLFAEWWQQNTGEVISELPDPKWN